MSSKPYGEPAFPCRTQSIVNGHDGTDHTMFDQSDPGMDLCQYAAIKLCVPDSGEDWLDDMIRESLRDRFAGQALKGFISANIPTPGADARAPAIIAKAAYITADAVLAERESARLNAADHVVGANDMVEDEAAEDRMTEVFNDHYGNPGTGSPIACDHANEVPQQCTCATDCYCKTRTCKPRHERAADAARELADHIINTFGTCRVRTLAENVLEELNTPPAPAVTRCKTTAGEGRPEAETPNAN